MIRENVAGFRTKYVLIQYIASGDLMMRMDGRRYITKDEEWDMILDMVEQAISVQGLIHIHNGSLIDV
jgi:hypothetical protein